MEDSSHSVDFGASGSLPGWVMETVFDKLPEVMVMVEVRFSSLGFGSQVAVSVTISEDPLPLPGLIYIHESSAEAAQSAALMKVTVPELSPLAISIAEGPMKLMAGSGSDGSSGPGCGCGSGLHCHNSRQATTGSKYPSRFFIRISKDTHNLLTKTSPMVFLKTAMRFQFRKDLTLWKFQEG